jgi:hypothetical protein
MRAVARVLRAGLLVAGGAYLAYLVAINVFLSTALFERVVDGDPRTLDIHYDRGWSLWPGRVHARSLSVRSRDGSVEWMLRIRKVQFDLSFLALARQRFQASHVRGTGGSFRLRNRLDPWEVSPERVAGLPPIEGYPAVPVRPYSQCSIGEWSDAHYHLWTIQLDDIHAEGVEELWVNRYQLEGYTSASGRFYLKPVRAVEVGPLHAEIRGSRLGVGGATWASGLDGSADFALPRFDPRLRDGGALLQDVSVGVETHGVVPDVALLPLPLPSDVRVHGALEMRRLALRFERGGPRRGSHLDLLGPQVVGERGDYRLSSSVALTGDIEGNDEGLAFHAVAGGARLERVGASAVATASKGEGDVLLLAPRIDLVGASERPTADHGIAGLRVTLESPDLELPDVRVLASYIPASARVTLAGGRARGQVWAQAWPDEGRATGRASMQAEGLRVKASDVRASGELEARASLGSLDWRSGRLERPEALLTVRSRVEIGQPRAGAPDKSYAADVDATAQARGFDPRAQTVDVSGSGVAVRNMVVAGQPAASSWADAALREATLRLDPPELQGVASADVTEATPLLAGVRDHVPGPFRGLLDLPRLLASARLKVDARHAGLSELEARGGALTVHGVFAAGRGDRLGAFVVEGGPVSVGVRVDPRGAHVHFFGLSGWLQEEEENVTERFGAP